MPSTSTHIKTPSQQHLNSSAKQAYQDGLKYQQMKREGLTAFQIAQEHNLDPQIVRNCLQIVRLGAEEAKNRRTVRAALVELMRRELAGGEAPEPVPLQAKSSEDGKKAPTNSKPKPKPNETVQGRRDGERYKQMRESGLTVVQIAEQCKIDPQSVRNRLQLLHLTEGECQKFRTIKAALKELARRHHAEYVAKMAAEAKPKQPELKSWQKACPGCGEAIRLLETWHSCGWGKTKPAAPKCPALLRWTDYQIPTIVAAGFCHILTVAHADSESHGFHVEPIMPSTGSGTGSMAVGTTVAYPGQGYKVRVCIHKPNVDAIVEYGYPMVVKFDTVDAAKAMAAKIVAEQTPFLSLCSKESKPKPKTLREDYEKFAAKPIDAVVAVPAEDRTGPEWQPAPDWKVLTDLNERMAVALDRRIRAIAEGKDYGLYLQGEGSVGKTFRVVETLKRLDVKYVYHSSGLTGRGLLDELQEHPDKIHVLDDVDRFFSDPLSIDLLRQALWGQPDRHGQRVRIIKHTTKREAIRFPFTGGIIIIANQRLENQAAKIRALEQRLNPLTMDMSGSEVAALLRHVASQGEYALDGKFVKAEPSKMVAEFILTECRRLNKPVTLRLFHKALGDYLISPTDWQTTVSTRIAETMSTEVIQESRREQTANKSRIAKEIAAEYPGDRAKQIAAWKAVTGEGKSSFYAFLKK